jgi:predicted aspartyl protease
MTKNLIILILIFTSFRGTSQDLIESIPMRFIDNYIFIEVAVNDNEKPLNFLFDTGAGITVVDNNIAKQLSLDINKESKISTSGKSLLSKESTSNIVKIGKSVHLDSINLILMDLSHLSKYLNTNVDGVIGYDLLSRFIIETNIDNKVFKFYEYDTFLYKGNSKPIELTRLESNLFGILINVIPKNRRESIVLNFEIDTGADNYLSFHNKIVEKYQLVDLNKKQKLRKGFGADSTITNNIRSKVKLVEFGGKKWKNIPVMFEVDPINKRENSLADGLIGQRLLLDFNIIYNLKKRLIYLENRK